jgi:hypothetical protein
LALDCKFDALRSTIPLQILHEFAPAKRSDLVALVSCSLGTVFANPARKNNRVVQGFCIQSFSSF